MQTKELIDELAPLLAQASGHPIELIRDRMLARANRVALPESQAALLAAQTKRDRKAEKLSKIFGGN
jgi:hypothetical protein